MQRRLHCTGCLLKSLLCIVTFAIDRTLPICPPRRLRQKLWAAATRQTRALLKARSLLSLRLRRRRLHRGLRAWRGEAREARAADRGRGAALLRAARIGTWQHSSEPLCAPGGRRPCVWGASETSRRGRSARDWRDWWSATTPHECRMQRVDSHPGLSLYGTCRHATLKYASLVCGASCPRVDGPAHHGPHWLGFVSVE